MSKSINRIELGENFSVKLRIARFLNGDGWKDACSNAGISQLKMLTGQDPGGVAAKLGKYKQALLGTDNGTKLLRLNRLTVALRTVKGDQSLAGYAKTISSDLEPLGKEAKHAFFDDLVAGTSHYQRQWASYVKGEFSDDQWEGYVKVRKVLKEWTKVSEKENRRRVLELVDHLKIRETDQVKHVLNLPGSVIRNVLDAVDNDGPTEWLAVFGKVSTEARFNAWDTFSRFLLNVFFNLH